MIEKTIALYPKIGLRAKVDRMSETNPIEGRIMM